MENPELDILGSPANGDSKKQIKSGIEKKLPVEDTGKYTQGCCQKKRGLNISYIVLFILFLYRGLTGGILSTIT